jgi:hypothetical protein
MGRILLSRLIERVAARGDIERGAPLRATTRRSTGDPVARCAGDRRHHHRPHSPELHRRPELESAKKKSAPAAEAAGVVRRKGIKTASAAAGNKSGRPRRRRPHHRSAISRGAARGRSVTHVRCPTRARETGRRDAARPARCSGSWPHDSMVRSPAAPSPIPFS